MRSTCGVLLLLLVVPASLAMQSMDRALVVIDDPPPAAKASLLADNIIVVGDMDRYLLALASSQDLKKIAEYGLDARILDGDVMGNTYYTASSRHLLRDKIRQRIRILRDDGYDAVIEVEPQMAEWLAGQGVDIARVFLRPVHLAPPEKPRRKVAQPDPIIETMVSSVSSSRIDATVGRLQDFETRYSTHDSCQSAASYIKTQFESFAIDSVYFHHWSDTYKDNVIATLPGVGDTQEIVIIGGHYDSVTENPDSCPGADDNASGIAGVLECARVLANKQFGATIKFIAFCAEEQGLLGSAAYAQEALASGDDIIAMINMDMIGYLAPGDVADLDIVDNQDSRWLRDLVMSVGAVYVPELPLVDASLPVPPQSDQRSFWFSGYDAIMFYEDSGSASPYIHTANDVVGTSYIAPQLAERSVKLGVALLATLAEPFRVVIHHSPLSHVDDPRQPHRVNLEVLSTGTVDVGASVLHYEVAGRADTVPLEYVGTGNSYDAYIPAQPVGDVIRYYIVVQDTDGYRVTHPKDAPTQAHRIVVGAPRIIVEDSLESPSGWLVGDIDDTATSGMWTWVDPNGTYFEFKPVQPEDDHTPGAGTHCFVTGDAPPSSTQTAQDVDDGKTTLFSPVFDLASYANAFVRYHRWYTNDTGGIVVTDTWVVDVTPDGGRSWVNLESLTSSHRSWHRIEEKISDYVPLTSQVQFRFVASDDEFPSIVEAAIDDFSIVTYVDSTTGSVEPPDIPPGVVDLYQNFPNPFNPETRIVVRIGEPGKRVTLKVYDVSGKVVATLLRDEFLSGERTVLWDSRDVDGRAVATGVYFYRLETGGRSLARKLVVLR